MRKYLIGVVILIALALGIDYVHMQRGFSLGLFNSHEAISVSASVEGKDIYLDRGNGPELFEIKGVDMGAGVAGYWATDFQIDKETYLRWFEQIQAMGANTLRIYTVHPESFYEAFYEYNKDNDNPLYLLHGVWISEYNQFSHISAFTRKFLKTFKNDCARMIDVIHGERSIRQAAGGNASGGRFTYDISPWVIGYIIGVEWEEGFVAYSDDYYSDKEGYTSFSGEYMYTSEDASPFETMLAEVGDSLIKYETERYGEQRLLAFSNWPNTDPFEYPESVQRVLHKDTQIDVEHILTTDNLLSGQFVSYHIYPYYPQYFSFVDDWKPFGLESKTEFLEDGDVNVYRAYLTAINNHHSMPVVISEFGVPSSRGMASTDINTGRNQGAITEKEQGEYIVKCYKDIKAAGCSGACLFAWQDEWFKRSWNTMPYIDTGRNAYWLNAQTSEQFYGVLAYDPGAEECACYVDGNTEEWTVDDVVAQSEGLNLSMKYDEGYVYFMLESDNLDPENTQLFIPIDTLADCGSNYCENYDIYFDVDADFLVVLDGQNNSRVLVQEYYEALPAVYSQEVYGYNAYVKDNIPEVDSPEFVKINMPLQDPVKLMKEKINELSFCFETGKLRYGNANPDSEDFDNIADFYYGQNCVEIRIPWELLNFSDPSQMQILNAFYETYGIEYEYINSMNVGISTGTTASRISTFEVPLEAWRNKAYGHERLKASYYAMQECWTSEEAEPVQAEILKGKTCTLPVVMYHQFATEADLAQGMQFGEYTIWNDEFEEDLRFLAENGYHTITCQQLIDYINGLCDLPDKPILLTSDDARYNNYVNAWPLLQKYGMTMTLSVIGKEATEASAMGGTGIKDGLSATWEQLKEMADSGYIELASHTYGFHYQESEDVMGAIARPEYDDFADKAQNDYLTLRSAMKRYTGSFVRALLYPYSARNELSDTIWTNSGYQLLFTGDFTHNKSERLNTVVQGSCETPEPLIRLVRYSGTPLEEYLTELGY